ncbi:MAG TPA: diphthamide synthesis protein [Candidatus Nanoarchaeia archaeon]|nr:diphthamide synthesis protein [Candidatus Nanoarchaeia archaeon]
MTLYFINLEQAVQKIRQTKAKTVCIQLPDGMKPYAEEIERDLSKIGVRVLIWLGSNFGACDIPLGLQRLGVDLLICWGHNKFIKKEGW